MSKVVQRSKSKRTQHNRLSSTKRKQELENANVIESNSKHFMNYEKVKRVLDIGFNSNENDKRVTDPSGIRSPHFYKPQKNKLFYIPKVNKLIKNSIHNIDCTQENLWIRETTNDQFQEYLYTEVNSPGCKFEFEQIPSPNSKLNIKFLSTKNTTEETDEFGNRTATELFCKTLNKGTLKDFIPTIPFSASKLNKEDSIQSCIKLSLDNKSNKQCEQNGSHESSQKDNAPSMKDVKENSSYSTIDKIQPNDLMEDSLNTCSLKRDSINNKLNSTEKKQGCTKEDSFMKTLSSAINQFGITQVKTKKTKSVNARKVAHASCITSPNLVNEDNSIQIIKKIPKVPSKILKYNKSAINKSQINNTNSFVDFRSPKKVMKTNFKKFYIDKVLKTENDAHYDEQHFNLDCEVKDSMEEDIIEDSMNMETEETPLQNKVHQLEQEVKRLKRIIKEERAKNKQLEFALYNKNKIDQKDAIKQVLSSLCLSDQISLSNGRKSGELCSVASPQPRVLKEDPQKIFTSKGSISRSKERHGSIENYTSIK